MTYRLALACVLSAVVSGCGVQNERTDLVATKLIEPTAAAGSGGGGVTCTLDQSGKEQSLGFIDVTGPGFYSNGLVVENRLSVNGGGLRLNSNDFQIEQVRVDYQWVGTNGPAIPEHLNPANGVIPAGASKPVAGIYLTPDVLPLLKTVTLPAFLKLQIRAEGHLLDGRTVSSSQYDYTIEVCSGAGCPGGVACPAGKTALGCNPGQDTSFVCQ